MSIVFLSDVLGKKRGAGHDACDQLVQYAVPAARKAGIRVLWVNWGLTEQEIEEMPPAVLAAFGFEGQRGGENVPVNKFGQIGGYKGPGREMGAFKDPKSGKEVDAGRLLMRDQWNSALLPPLDEMYEEGAKLNNKPDVWIHKNRMSGIWTQTALSDFLSKENIKTIFFTGVNTDQCVGGTYQDCFSKGCVNDIASSIQCIDLLTGRLFGTDSTPFSSMTGVERPARSLLKKHLNTMPVRISMDKTFPCVWDLC